MMAAVTIGSFGRTCTSWLRPADRLPQLANECAIECRASRLLFGRHEKSRRSGG